MSYPLINGAPINGDGGGDITLLPPSLHILDAGIAKAVGGTTAGDAEPLAFGTPSVEFAFLPPSLQILDAGVHLAFHDWEFTPPSLHILDHGTPNIRVNPVAGDAMPLRFGPAQLRIGTDINARPASLRLPVAGLHVANVGAVLPSDGATVAGNARPVRFGVPAFAPAAVLTTAGGASPVRFGTAALGVALTAGAAEPVRLGAPGPLGFVMTAGGVSPVRLGVPTLSVSYLPPSLRILMAGTHAAVSGGTSTTAGDAEPVRMGAPGPVGHAAIARQHFPVRFGTPSIDRGTTC